MLFKIIQCCVQKKKVKNDDCIIKKRTARLMKLTNIKALHKPLN